MNISAWAAGIISKTKETIEWFVQKYAKPIREATEQSAKICEEKIKKPLEEGVKRYEEMAQKSAEEYEEMIRRGTETVRKMIAYMNADRWQREKMKVPNNERKRKGKPLVRRRSHLQARKNARYKKK